MKVRRIRDDANAATLLLVSGVEHLVAGFVVSPEGRCPRCAVVKPVA